MADNKEEATEHGGEDHVAEEEEAKVDFKPLVKLPEVAVVTHEEDEDTLFKMQVFVLLLLLGCYLN